MLPSSGNLWNLFKENLETYYGFKPIMIFKI